MYSVFFSKIDKAIDIVTDKLIKIIKPNSKALIFPWAFPIEINNNEFENEYFLIGGKRYSKYLNALKKVGIKKDNFIIYNPYRHSKEELIKLINESDILILPGGNPEMFFKKVAYDTEILYDIKNFKGIVIGESAGAELQFERYFITSANNFYKYFAFYDGFGLINNPFYIDVHTINNNDYLKELKNAASMTKKTVYGIHDDGVIIYNRENENIELYGHVDVINHSD